MYVTQSRQTPGSVIPGRWKSDALSPSLGKWVPIANATGVPTVTEVTSSYRTGKGAAEQVSDDDSIYVGVNSAGGSFGKYRTEYSRDVPNTMGRQHEYDNGHTFSTKKHLVGFVSHKEATVRGRTGAGAIAADNSYVYVGPLVPNPAAGGLGPTQWIPSEVPGSTGSDVAKYGVQAISTTIPTLPAASLSQTLVETVREGIPKMVGAQLITMRDTVRAALGGEYLNIEFGWKPLISDLRACCHAILSAGKLLEQLERDSGRNVRRQYTFPDEKDSSTITGLGSIYSPTHGGSAPFLRAFSARSNLRSSHTEVKTTKKWFSGAYTYHLAPSSGAVNKVKRAQQQAAYLLGLELTPELLWEVAPWSWLADWVGNIGENLTNATRLSSDDLVIKYGYLMVQTEVSYIRTLSGAATYRDGPLGDLTFETRFLRKERFRATPFGFGINTDAFSAKQWSILGALGMTKSDRALRLND